MKCIHHTDADGLCAAAIVYRELNNIYQPAKPSDFIPYNYGWKLELPGDVKAGETIYIVDLSLDDVIMNAIEFFVAHGCDVVHIDHHISTQKFYAELPDERRKIYDEDVIKFFSDKISGCMLTWVYACMNVDERSHPQTVVYDFAERYTHVCLWIDTPNAREISIPLSVRLIDDNDVWRHEYEESKYFAIAFNSMTKEHKIPTNNNMWDKLIYSSTQMETLGMISRGKMLFDYQASINEMVLKNAFEYEIMGIKTLCLNTQYGNSQIFGEKYNEYDIVCKFGYDGNIRKWRYTFYSNGKNPDVDCSEIARTLFAGGGHRCAAGGMLEYNYFEI